MQRCQSKAKIYLTIDDSPSERFVEFSHFLKERGISALFFNRGDYMDERPDAVIQGIRDGHVMGNHTYSHKRASQISFEEWRNEVIKTDNILEHLYERAERPRPGKYFRPPYMDRGMGIFLADPQKISQENNKALFNILAAVMKHDKNFNPQGHPTEEGLQMRDKMQGFLKDFGFDPLFSNVLSFEWFMQTELKTTFEVSITDSIGEWSLLKRHQNNPDISIKNINDIKKRIDTDPSLHDETSHHVVLMHEYAELYDQTTDIIDYMLNSKKFEFLPIPTQTKQTDFKPTKDTGHELGLH